MTHGIYYMRLMALLEASGIGREEFRQLYESAYGFVRERARTLLRDEDAALDATQEAFIKAWEHWPQVAVAKSPIGWLVVTVTRLCLDRLRHRKIVQAHAQAPQHEVSTYTRDSHLARLIMLRLHNERRLQQQVVIHVWIDEMTQDEVAQLLGVSRKTVQRQLEAFRAKHQEELAALVEVRHD